MLKKRVITLMLWNGTTLVKGTNFNNSRRAGHPLTTMQIYNNRDVDEIIFYDIEKNAKRENEKIDQASHDVYQENLIKTTEAWNNIEFSEDGDTKGSYLEIEFKGKKLKIKKER